MFKRFVNHCSIELFIEPQSAMLIKSGVAQVSGIDMAWVRTPRNGRQEVFLPGSSLKGMLRAHSERIAKTLNKDATCNPLAEKRSAQRSCSHALDALKKEEYKKEDVPTPIVYKKSCPICRAYGNQFIMGRVATQDAYLSKEPPPVQQRDGVGIDRFTGGAARGAKFELEVITSGEFKVVIELTNFELWQLGLLGFVIEDLRDGLVRLGSGKSRGMGKIVADRKQGDVTLEYVGRRAEKPLKRDGQYMLYGAGALIPDAEDYGMAEDDEIAFSSETIKEKDTPFKALRQSAVMPFDALPWEALAEKWVTCAESASDALHRYRRGGAA